MVGVVFSEEADNEAGNVLCAVFDLERLAQGNITFGDNSYRGDVYAPELRRAVERWEQER